MPTPYRILAAVLVAIALATGGYNFGRHVMAGEVAQEKLDDALAYAEVVREEQGKGDQLAANLAAARAVQAPKDRLITKEITRYVQVTPPAQRCTLPGTWRVRHDAAATGMPIDAEAGSVAVGSAGPVEDAAALETVGENYAAARECIAKLNGWLRRYRVLEEADQ